MHDPYLPRAMADELGVLATSLDEVMGGSDVVISLVPPSPRTRGMLGRRELDRFLHGHDTRFDLDPPTLANRRGAAPSAAQQRQQ